MKSPFFPHENSPFFSSGTPSGDQGFGSADIAAKIGRVTDGGNGGCPWGSRWLNRGLLCFMGIHILVSGYLIVLYYFITTIMSHLYEFLVGLMGIEWKENGTYFANNMG
jgi:hypothetical protein